MLAGFVEPYPFRKMNYRKLYHRFWVYGKTIKRCLKVANNVIGGNDILLFFASGCIHTLNYFDGKESPLVLK